MANLVLQLIVAQCFGTNLNPMQLLASFNYCAVIGSLSLSLCLSLSLSLTHSLFSFFLFLWLVKGLWHGIQANDDSAKIEFHGNKEMTNLHLLLHSLATTRQEWRL